MKITIEADGKVVTLDVPGTLTVTDAAPSPEPTPAPQPDPTPAPAPDPQPTPAPDPIPDPTPDPAPPPDPVPSPDQPRYRHQMPTLFQRVDQASVKSRVVGGKDMACDSGPTASFVSVGVSPTGVYCVWPWDNPGGDWLDADGVRQGTKSWTDAKLNAVSGSTAQADYIIDVTRLVQYAQQQGRWLAVLMKCSAPRKVSGRFSDAGLPNNQNRPQVRVAYEYGTEATLDCLVTAAIGWSTMAQTVHQEIGLPAMIEFERPTKPVSSASLALRVTQHWDGSDPSLRLFLLDPPVHFPEVETGIANDAPRDEGLPGHEAIIGVHRYIDGSKLEDFAYFGAAPMGGTVWNVGAEHAFDPAIYGTGPQDLTKLPHAGLGKWINARAYGKFDLVPSTHDGDGFAPLADGIGAIRVEMPQEVFKDGDVVGYSGTCGSIAKLFMPEPLFGRLRHIFVRQYFRIGTVDGGPYEVDPTGSFQVRHGATDAPIWLGAGGGKGLVMPAHDTTYGGVSGSSGGGRGWQMRMGWRDADYKGPEEGGYLLYPHFYDFLANNPPGHQYGGQDKPVGGLYPQGVHGTVAYAHRWYCFETELYLNTVMDEAPGFVADGYMRQWIDGRLCYSASGMVFRTLPLVDKAPNSSLIRPIRELGVRDLWFNWFHGGTVKNSRPRVMFLTGLAWGHKYIGPMKF